MVVNDESIDRLVQQMSKLIISNENMMKLVEDHERKLYGKNGEGLFVRLDRLEQTEGNRKWNLRAIWVAIISAIAAALFGHR